MPATASVKIVPVRKMAVQRAFAVVGVAVAAGIGAFLIRGVHHRASRALTGGGVTESRTVAGFGQVRFKVTGPALPVRASSRASCALLASTEAQQMTGLMNRHDLAGYAGMIFRFARPTTVPFFMKNTLIPLSIAWFDATGRFLNATTMSPCPRTSLKCPLYYAIAPYSIAIEVGAGALPQLGIGPGATIAVGGLC
jgi:uncharacterized membrane protein (UPF0127 family)